MKIIRVFPRRTKATPADENTRVATPPGMFDEADEIHVSVAFEWDKPAAEELAFQWERVAPVKIGGPAYGDPGGEFEPGMYLKPGYVITSRGCPNHCWFCRAWRNEGDIRELEIKDGYNVLDNNLTACSPEHQERVFQMLSRQKERTKFTGGFEAARFTEWHAEWMARLKPQVMYFAYDRETAWESLMEVAKLCNNAGLINKHQGVRCYVLIGYDGDTIEAAAQRLMKVVSLGIMPMAMLYDKGAIQRNVKTWRKFQTEWVRPTIIGTRMKRC